MTDEMRKVSGSYYTPDDVVRSLVKWAVRHPGDRMLDPSCGDGRFLAVHRNSAGVEQDHAAAYVATQRAPWAMVHEGDFFSWAAETEERFDAAAGNPPFIRYQRFTGEVRQRALSLCRQLGADFSGLTSSWAPFLVATCSLLLPGGRLAFVVPAEIGHAPYAVPLIEYLAGHFAKVRVIAVRERLFPDLSEDCWLLQAEGFGANTPELEVVPMDVFHPMEEPPSTGATKVSLGEWRRWNYRLRPFLISHSARDLYSAFSDDGATRLGDVARVGIGYVTGDNDFFHLRPSVADGLTIPDRLLHPAVRNGKALSDGCVTVATVRKWILADEPVLLLKIAKDDDLPDGVKRYLDSSAGHQARKAYKCRMRDPWYSVPDVTVPDAFVSYMSSQVPSLVANGARCVCTNSLHAVHLNGRMSLGEVQRRWDDPLTALSCELEGHPLGGGVLKLEPREASRVVLPKRNRNRTDDRVVLGALREMRKWRHYV